MKDKKWLTWIIDILLIFVVFRLCDTSGIKKYMIILMLSVLFFIRGMKKSWSADALLCLSMPMLTYLFLGTIGSTLNGHFYINTFKILAFWLVPLVAAFSIYVYAEDKMKYIVNIQMISIAFVYLGHRGIEVWKMLGSESIYAFTFGAFFLYYIFKKRWFWAVLSFALMCNGDKRITVLATACSLLILGVLWLFRYNEKLIYAVWGMTIGAIISYIYLICSGTLRYYSEGLGINTNGRMVMYDRMLEYFRGSKMFLGQGLGIVEENLQYWNISSFGNLHNDLLKFYFELGIIGLFIFLMSYGVMFFFVKRTSGKAEMAFMLSVTMYSMILFTTDNVSIYITYMLPLYSLCFAILSGNEKKERESVYD